MATYKLLQNNINVLLIDKGPNDVEYKKTHGKVSQWFAANNDPTYFDNYSSIDDKSIWIGKGIGGGTLHFGMQYIDQFNVLNKTNPEIASLQKNIKKITKTKSYKYDNSNNNDYWNILLNNLKNKTNNDENINVFNNTIYSRDLDNRFIASDILDKNNENLTIFHNCNVNKLFFEKNKRNNNQR